MSEKTRDIKVFCPQIGHGNPLTALAIGDQLGEQTDVNIFGGRGYGVAALRFLHQLMSSLDHASSQYTEKSESLRGGIGAFVIGLLQLESWLREERLEQFKGRSLSQIGVFVQEHLLGILPEGLLERWFPQGVFLYIPDVFPKASAVKILKAKNVRPIVWNRQAFDELQEKGLDPILAQPVLPFSLIEAETILTGKPQKKVLKSSGSGISGKYLQTIVNSRQEGEILEIWLPDRKIIYDSRNKDGRVEFTPGNLKEYGRSFYTSILDAGEIISYPSEMVQVISSLLTKGWRGRFRVLPPRGRHEKRNFEWLKSFIAPTEEDGFLVFDFSSEKAQEAIDCLLESLGKEDLSSVIEKNKRKPPFN